jgi:hypothetical protein
LASLFFAGEGKPADVVAAVFAREGVAVEVQPEVTPASVNANETTINEQGALNLINDKMEKGLLRRTSDSTRAPRQPERKLAHQQKRGAQRVNAREGRGRKETRPF